MPTLIWTRSVRDWDQDRVLLESLVPPPPLWKILHVPCIRLKACDGPLPRSAAGSSWTHVIITSPHTLEFGEPHGTFCQILANAQGIFTHGPKTAQALSQRGFRVTLVPEAKTAEDLGAALLPRLPTHARILIPGPREPAFDLAGYLGAQGRMAASWAIYETESWAHGPSGRDLSAFDTEAIRRTTAQGSTVICLASPSAITGWLKVFPDILPQAVAIGATTARAAQGVFPRVTVAPQATLADLIRKSLEVA